MKDRQIETLEGGEHIRLRMSMYLDGDSEKALQLALREIWVNSCDELTFRKKKGLIAIYLNKSKRTLMVSDNGGGIPSDKLIDAYLTANTGSNFHNREGNLSGANGIGIKAVSHTASWVEVESIREKSLLSRLRIKHGEKQGEVESFVEGILVKTPFTGLKTTFSPSPEIYGDAWINEDSLLAELDEAAKFYPLITFEVNGEFGKKTIAYPKGLQLPKTEAYYESENLIVSLSLEPGQIKPFGNRLHLKDGGAFYTHFKTQLTKAINNTIDFKIKGEEIQSALSGYVAVYVNEPVFSNQQKSAIGNKEINPEISTAVQNVVAQLQKSRSWNKFITALEAETKAQAAAERAREKVLGAMKDIAQGSKKKIAAEKLKDCLSHGEEAWLAICEGDSAASALNLARDVQSVATFPIKGKFINTLKNTPDKFLANEELIQICQILGCGIFENYKSKNLKYGKVLISSDADVDGLSVAALLITFFYTCMPEFIREGRLYWMKAPLYVRGDDEFIFTEEEWAKVKSKKGFSRLKGLGEGTSIQTKNAFFGPQKRWEQLVVKNWAAFEKTMIDLMGKDVPTRRELLFRQIDFERITFL